MIPRDSPVAFLFATILKKYVVAALSPWILSFHEHLDEMGQSVRDKSLAPLVMLGLTPIAGLVETSNHVV